MFSKHGDAARRAVLKYTDKRTAPELSSDASEWSGKRNLRPSNMRSSNTNLAQERLNRRGVVEALRPLKSAVRPTSGRVHYCNLP